MMAVIVVQQMGSFWLGPWEWQSSPVHYFHSISVDWYVEHCIEIVDDVMDGTESPA